MKTKFRELLNARPMAWKRFECTAENFEGFLDVLLGRVLKELLHKGRPPRKSVQLRDELKEIVLNLFYIRFSDPSRYLAIQMGSTAYKGESSYRGRKRAVSGLRATGLIGFKAGFRVEATGKGYTSRLRARAKLMRLAERYGITSAKMKRVYEAPLVTLRSVKDENGQRQDLPWPEDEASQNELRQITANLETINRKLAETYIGLHVPNALLPRLNQELNRTPEHDQLDFYRKRLHRVFNDGRIDLGGRFFGGWWQEVPRRYRRHIHLAGRGQEVLWAVEVDFKSLHPTLLYVREGRNPPEDCYDFGRDFPRTDRARDYAKAALLIMLNARDEASAIRAIREEVQQRYERVWRETNGLRRRPMMTIDEMLPEGCPGVEQMVTLLKEVHPAIADHFCSDIGKWLMYQDSRIAEQVMLRMIEAGTICLPIHDSFLARKGEHELLRDIMLASFRDVTGGGQCRVEEDDTELDMYVEGLDEEQRVGKNLDEVWDELILILNTDDDPSKSVYQLHRRDWGLGIAG